MQPVLRTADSASRRRSLRPRSGAVAVEFAIVTPLLLMVVFGAIEFARLNMLVHSVENAAYEGARRGMIPGATAAAARAEAEGILNAVGAIGATVTVTPEVITQASPEVTVAISLPLNSNAWLTPHFTKDATLSRSCRLTREVTTF